MEGIMQKSKRTFEKENPAEMLGEQAAHEKGLSFMSKIIYKLVPCFPLLCEPSPGITRTWGFSLSGTVALGKAMAS